MAAIFRLAGLQAGVTSSSQLCDGVYITWLAFQGQMDLDISKFGSWMYLRLGAAA